VEWVGLGTALEDQDQGLVSAAAVAWVEAAEEAPVDLEPGEAARGAVSGAVRRVRVGACGRPALVAAVELARDPGLRARAVRVRGEDRESGAAQVVEPVARAAEVGEVEAAVARVLVPGRAVALVAAVAGLARALEDREVVGERELLLLENG